MIHETHEVASNASGAELRPKVHPATREALPDDPMELHGVELPGDAEVMLRLLVEEYARMGWGAGELMELARDPFYQAFHGLRAIYGEAVIRKKIEEIIARVGVTRVEVSEKEPACGPLVQVDLPDRE